jgi:hypothetical protein
MSRITGSRARFRQYLLNHFSEEEVKTLCFDLEIDYDDLPGQGRTGKVRELLGHLERVGRIPDLIKLCQQLRPHIRWEVSRVSRQINAPSSGDCDDEYSRLSHPQQENGEIYDKKSRCQELAHQIKEHMVSYRSELLHSHSIQIGDIAALANDDDKLNLLIQSYRESKCEGVIAEFLRTLEDQLHSEKVKLLFLKAAALPYGINPPLKMIQEIRAQNADIELLHITVSLLAR